MLAKEPWNCLGCDIKFDFADHIPMYSPMRFDYFIKSRGNMPMGLEEKLWNRPTRMSYPGCTWEQAIVVAKANL